MITHNEATHSRRPVRRACRVATIAVAVLLACATAPTYAARAQHSSDARSPMLASANLSRQPQPGSPLAQAGDPTTLNLGEYKACARASYLPPSPEAGIVAGYSDINKLSGAAQIGSPNLAVVDSDRNLGITASSITYGNDQLQCILISLQLDYQGTPRLPPIRSTFLGFRFVPVTATAILSETAPIRTLVFQNQGPLNPPSATDTNTPFTAVSVARLELQLADVKINGVPLNVGTSCHTNGILFTPGNQVAPGELVLTGGTNLGDPVPSFGNALSGGAVAGDADIPPFTGCITPSGENLDALLTASVSGPGNFVRMTVGPLCPPTCTPTGQLSPKSAPLWTVTHGGQYTASGPLTLSGESGNPNLPNGITITCSQSEISGVFPDVTGPLRGGLATVQWNQIGGCIGSDGSTWQVAQQGTAYFGAKIFAQEGLGPGQTGGNIDQLALALTGKNVPGLPPTSSCHLFMAGYQPATYFNTGSLLTLGTFSTNVHVFASNCPDAPADGGANGSGDFGVTGTYTLRPGGIIITSP